MATSNRLENFELPGNAPGLMAETIALLNARFLRIAEKFKLTGAATSTGAVLEATHIERIGQARFSAESLTVGTQFWETDRGVVYIVKQVANALTWAFEAGLMIAARGSRPTDLTLYDQGFLFFATDDSTLYRWDGANWNYMLGTLKRTQSQLAGLAATLGTHDTGLLIWVTDYAHMLQWTGTAWQRGPGDPEHSDTFWAFGAAPADTGWHLCDGSSVNFLKYDGTTASRTLPNANGTACYAKLGSSYSATITAAANATFTGTLDTTSAVSAGTPSGTVSQPTFTGSALPNHQHDAPIGFDVNSVIYTLQVNGSSGGFTSSTHVAGTADTGHTIAALETSANSAGTPSGTVSQPTFTGSALGTHTHTVTPTGTVAFAGDPIAWFEAISYYRQ
jgi:hypothetical protein